MKKYAVIILGPPGSGKGTQAELLASNRGFIHFDTGRYIDKVVHDKDNATKETIKERKLYDSGILCSPSWVLKILKQQIVRLSHANFSIVFSGSPRTLFEAIGKGRTTGVMQFLNKLYGKKNITVFFLRTEKHAAQFRNNKRRLCSICGRQMLHQPKAKLVACPFCGGELRIRVDDDPKKYETRWKQFQERTEPIIKELKKQKYNVITIDGEQLPGRVYQDILKRL